MIDRLARCAPALILLASLFVVGCGRSGDDVRQLPPEQAQEEQERLRKQQEEAMRQQMQQMQRGRPGGGGR